MAGSALALLPPLNASRKLVLAAGAILVIVTLAPLTGNEGLLADLGVPLVAAAGSVLISVRGGPLAFTPLVWLGRISYSVYLWQFPILFGADLMWGSVPIWAVVLSFVLASLSSQYVERPFGHRLPERAGDEALATATA